MGRTYFPVDGSYTFFGRRSLLLLSKWGVLMLGGDRASTGGEGTTLGVEKSAFCIWLGTWSRGENQDGVDRC